MVANSANEKPNFISKNLRDKIKSDQEESFKDILVLSKKIELKVPVNFKLLERQILEEKYTSESRRPQEVYTNSDNTINIAFNYSQNKIKESELELGKVSLENQYKLVSVKFLKSEIKTINNKNFVILEYLNLTKSNELLHNYSFLTNLDGRLMMGNINYSEADKNFDNIKSEIVNSLKVNNE